MCLWMHANTLTQYVYVYVLYAVFSSAAVLVRMMIWKRSISNCSCVCVCVWSGSWLRAAALHLPPVFVCSSILGLLEKSIEFECFQWQWWQTEGEVESINWVAACAIVLKINVSGWVTPERLDTTECYFFCFNTHKRDTFLCLILKDVCSVWSGRQRYNIWIDFQRHRQRRCTGGGCSPGCVPPLL